MPRDLKQLTIFISGTNEVDAEKAALRRLIEELNRLLEKTHGLTLRVISWPDDVRPGVNVDPQAEITRQFGSAFDVYVGLLGTRFGTPTPRAGSGTEEEFEAALARFRSDSKSIRVLFYFKRTNENPFTMDVDQLRKVKGFREALPSRGVVYRDFKDTAEFVELVKDHLYNLVIDEWRGDQWSSIPPVGRSRSTGTVDTASLSESSGLPAVPALPVEPRKSDYDRLESGGATLTDVEDEEEPGVLDYLAGFIEAADALTKTAQRITQNTERVGEQVRARTAETSSLHQEFERVKNVGGSRAAQDFVLKARGVVDHAAANLDEFVNSMAADVEQYRLHSRAIFTYFRNSLKAGALIETTSQNENRTALTQLISVLQATGESESTLQSTISQVPALTGKFKRARKRSAAILGEFIAEISLTIDEAKRLIEELGGPLTNNTG